MARLQREPSASRTFRALVCKAVVNCLPAKCACQDGMSRHNYTNTRVPGPTDAGPVGLVQCPRELAPLLLPLRPGEYMDDAREALGRVSCDGWHESEPRAVRTI